MRWYHGSDRPLKSFREDAGRSDHENMLFMSASCNVCRRYGNFVSALDFDASGIPRMTVQEWLSGNTPPDESFMILGESDSFDFPVDTLVIRSDPGVPFQEISRSQMVEIDDGRAIREPVTTHDREWKLFVADIFDGDVKAWKKSTFSITNMDFN